MFLPKDGETVLKGSPGSGSLALQLAPGDTEGPGYRRD